MEQGFVLAEGAKRERLNGGDMRPEGGLKKPQSWKVWNPRKSREAARKTAPEVGAA